MPPKTNDVLQFPFIAYWAGGLVLMLFLAEHLPPAATYALLAILLIGALMGQQAPRTTGPK